MSITDTGLPQLNDPAYKVESKLGSGGGGIVYKAWHERLQKYVVLKRIKEDSGLTQEQYRIEVDILKNLKHSHLPQMYDFLVDSGGIYTVMEYIPGTSLSDVLKTGQRFMQQDIVRWAEQLSSALAYLHKQNPPVLHSDIKPANIMLTPQGDVCLIDFNISVILGDDAADMIGLSHGYASPEQYGPQALPVTSQSGYIPPFANGQHDPAATDLGPAQNRDEQYNPNETVIETPETILSSDNTYDPRIPVMHIPASPQSEQRRKSIRMDMRSDIYSFGATLYHLLTGEKPAISTGKIKSLSEFGISFSEGIVYIVERCMEHDPAKRFQTAGELYEAVINIHHHDTRWKVSRSKRIVAAVILPVAFAIFAATALYGKNVMAQELEESYYTAIYDIENSNDPQRAYEAALDMFLDRIDPYRAMALRLWNDGNIDACRNFIGQNLGNIAKFAANPETERGYGDIYYILGNCYYTSIEPDYHLAAGNFEIAVRYVRDNAVYFRDYAISIARTGKIDEAEQMLDTARTLGLSDDSLSLLNGEIAFSKNDYENSLGYFKQVIETTAEDYIRYRAYRTSDEIYRILGLSGESVKLLEGALEKIPFNRVPEMTERLAVAYVRNGDYDSAIKLFEQLASGGVPQYHLLESLAILLHNEGELDRAEAVLIQMEDFFPNDYRVPMRMAYLEADRQSQIANEHRNYMLTKQYYEKAVNLYNNNVRPGENDPEMQQLDRIIEQLRTNGWIT